MILFLLPGLEHYPANTTSRRPVFSLTIPRRIEDFGKYGQVKSKEPQDVRDVDHDGIDDSLEQELAEKFAPVIFHDPDEPNLPANVKLFLPTTELWFYDKRCKRATAKIVAAPFNTIPHRRQAPCSRADDEFDSEGSRSRNKERTFFLATVDKVLREGSCDPHDWTTYFHAYPNDISGITIEYWRFYAYNTGYVFGIHTQIGSHGGDWEAVHVVLDRNYRPVKARFLGHRSIVEKRWSELITLEDHLLIRSEKGGHTSKAFDAEDQQNSQRFIRQETWSGGRVSWPSRHRLCRTLPLSGEGGDLVNLGEKLFPFPGMEFIQYSGLWGGRETGGFLSRLRSGYWGPAFNETGMGKDGFIAAWCQGMQLRDLPRTDKANIIRECYPTRTSR